MSEWSILLGVVSLIVALGNFAHNRFVVEVQTRERLRAVEEQVLVLKSFPDKLDTGLNHTERQLEALIAEETKELIRRIVAIEAHTNDIPVIKMQLGLFWKAVESHVPDLLLHPDAIDRDVLIMKAKNGTITQEEAATLKALLEVELKHLPDNSPESWPIFVYSVYCDYIAKGIRPT